MNPSHKNKAFIVEKTKDGDFLLKNKYGIYSKKELEKQLKEGCFTIAELGSIYGLKSFQLVHVLRSLGIVHRNGVNETRVLNPTITPSMHQVLIGTLLGDGYMQGPKIYCLGHGVDQMDYCYHVAIKLHPFVASFGDFNVPAETLKSFSFWTYRHEALQDYSERFYSCGFEKKIFLKKSAFDLEPEGLAYWYMDDGKFSEYGAHLCVGDVSEEEGTILRDLLRGKFNIETTFQVHDSKNDYHTIYVKAQSREQFFSLIDPHIIDSMRYKVRGEVFPRHGFVREKIYLRHKELCETAGRFIRYFGDGEIAKKVEKACSGIKDAKDVYAEKINRAIAAGSQISKTVEKVLPDEKELSLLLSEGKTDAEIAKMYSIGRNRVSKLRRALNIQDSRSRLSVQQIEKVKELMTQSKVSIKEMMKCIGVSYYKAKELIVEYGPSK